MERKIVFNYFYTLVVILKGNDKMHIIIIQRKIAIIFLTISLNMCFVCSKEPSQ